MFNRTKVKCLLCSKVYSVSKKEFEKAKLSADKETKILALICPKCEGSNASTVAVTPFIKSVKSWLSSTAEILWDKFTDILALATVNVLSIWAYWKYDMQAIFRQLLTYLIIFMSAYFVTLYSPLKNYLLAIVVILLISFLQIKQGR